MKKTIIVMPVANEEDTIGAVLEQILSLPYDDLFVYPILDAYSKDKTQSIVMEYENMTNGRVRCIYYEKSNGVASCYLYGFQAALKDGAEYIIEMDGGGSHQPDEIPRFIDKLEDGYDCVWGSRFIPGGCEEGARFYRKILSKGGTLLSNLVLHTRLKDMTSGFEAFQRHVLADMDFERFLSTGHMYQTEMRFYCKGFYTIEIPIHYIAGVSVLKMKSVTEALGILFQLKRNERCVLKGNNVFGKGDSVDAGY